MSRRKADPEAGLLRLESLFHHFTINGLEKLILPLYAAILFFVNQE
jgi:hypothetical protein